MLFFLTVLHFLVDGVCAAALAAYAVQEPVYNNIVHYFLLYTVIAFGTQWLAGLFLDKKIRYLRPAFLLVFATLTLGALPQLGIVAQAVLLGIGNCLFHVAGGIIVLRSKKTYKELGIFVSTGAVGLGLGLNLYLTNRVLVPLCVIFTLLVYRALADYKLLSENEDPKREEGVFSFLPCVILLIICIVFRSFGSASLVNDPFVMTLPVILCLGKMLGGFVCDRLGYKKTVLVIFLLGFLGLQAKGFLPSAILILSWNMTMPLTLRLMHFSFPAYPGLMFGLAAGALVPGAVLAGKYGLYPEAIVAIQFILLAAAGMLYQKRRSGEVAAND